MSWDSLLAFVRSEAPAFVDSMKGVTRQDIALVETHYRIDLPEAYRQFLLLMGEDGAGFSLFGPSQNQRFRDVIAHIPEASWPVQEYFKISFADDSAMVSPPDYFLDLTRADGNDAPVVMFEDDEEFSREDVQERGFTFLEQLHRRLFGHVANDRLPERALVAVPIESNALTMPLLIAMLEEMRFARALDPLVRVRCLRREGMWALVDVDPGGHEFAMSFWSDERSRLAAVIDQLSVRFPDAVAVDRGRSPKGPV